MTHSRERPVSTERQGEVLRVAINRPQVRNAFDRATVDGLADVFAGAAADPSLRALVLEGAGGTFCAGADLNWMRESANSSGEWNRQEARRLAGMFEAFESVPAPTVAIVRGAALGGGTGLLACADIALVERSARLGFTEVRLGIVPSVISPFLLGRVQPGAMRRYFLTGEIFDGCEAVRIGLASEALAPEELAPRAEAVLGSILAAGPVAVRRAKRLLRDLSGWTREEAREATADLIAEIRASPEAREGLDAFLNKRRPAWRSTL